MLGLNQAPLRIECFDMAHLHGTDYVGSMVVLEDGLPLKREYRKFNVTSVIGNDDYAAMREVLTRRLSAYVAERDAPTEERGAKPGKFAYPPQLLLVDGGKGQLAVAVDVVRDNRLLPQEDFTTTHVFQVSCAEPVVTATLLHRRFPFWLNLQRGWDTDDRLMSRVSR